MHRSRQFSSPVHATLTVCSLVSLALDCLSSEGWISPLRTMMDRDGGWTGVNVDLSQVQELDIRLRKQRLEYQDSVDSVLKYTEALRHLTVKCEHSYRFTVALRLTLHHVL